MINQFPSKSLHKRFECNSYATLPISMIKKKKYKIKRKIKALTSLLQAYCTAQYSISTTMIFNISSGQASMNTTGTGYYIIYS